MSYLKKYKLLIGFSLILLFLEIFLRFFWAEPGNFRHNPLDSKFEALGVAIKQKPQFYQERFCDSIHQTKYGEKEASACIFNDIKPLVKTTGAVLNLLTAGASTTHGYNCNSETSWPNELSLLDAKLNILNIADDGGYSDESIIKIENQLQQNKIPDILIWGHGFTEFLFYGDERDINWEKLKLDYNLIAELQKDRAYKENLILKVLRFDITLQKYIYFYKFLRTKFNLVTLAIQNGYIKFLLSLPSEEDSNSNAREKFIASSGFLGGPVRMMFSEATQNYALNNYRLNLQRLSNLSQKHKFKVVCIKFPYVKGLLSYFSNEFSEKYDNWLEKVNEATEETCKKLKFTVSDVDHCYLSIIENSK